MRQYSRENRDLTIEDFAGLLCSEQPGRPMGKVSYKFVRNMLSGIHRTRSVNLTDIAKGLDEKINLHATHKRLSRNLQNAELAANLSDRLLRLGARDVNEDTRLIVHLYALNKKYARKIEYLPDTGGSINTGFRVCEILASDPGAETWHPLLARVWSDQIPGYVDDAREIKNAILDVYAATGNKGMLYFDDTTFTGKLLEPFMKDPGFSFIALLREDLEVVYRNETCAMGKLLEQVETRYGKTLFKLIPEGLLGAAKTDVDLFMHVGALGIKLPGCDRPLSLIALKSNNSFLGEIETPMITSRTHLRSRKSLMGLVESFLSIQDILSAHQALRNKYNPSNFRVLTWDRLQLLMTLLHSVLHYQVSTPGKAPVGDHLFAAKPHGGKFNRTYLLPGGIA